MQNGSVKNHNATSVLVNLSSVPKYESVVDAAGAIPIFVQMLHSNDSNETVHAALAIANLTADVSVRDSIGHAGAIPPLARLVKYGGDEEKSQATAALIDLAVERHLRSQISRENCIPSLVELVRSGTDLQQERAAHLLQNLALSSANEAKIGEAGAIGPLLRMVKNGNDVHKEKATRALVNLSHNAENKRVITKSDGIARLAKLLLDGNQVHKEYTMAILWNLVTMKNVETLYQIVNASTIPLLAQLAQHGSTPRQCDEARRTMVQFSIACLEHPAVDMDVIPALVAVVGGQSSPARSSAAAALANLSYQDKSAYIPVILESGGVHVLIKLLRDENPGDERECGIIALVNLSNYTEAKTAIVDAGGLAALSGLSQVGTEREQDFAQCALSKMITNSKFHLQY
ncbi:hypothetical protein PHMEG_00028296 [Phytophthora megakarya]|uniref:Armadillo repeat-containing domain-containing protein n=1 Tax=Phytophthora megakarya TaxID=4795 RepID=A0A225V6C0_9STRA|nr:hypothetical protein PHMEG_00028296 [Phytophthora megakarya]